MRILLTGATGFVGASICAALLDAGHEVVAVHRGASPPTDLKKHSSLRWVSGDFASDQEASDWLPRLSVKLGEEVVPIDAVVNAAGIIRERGTSTFEAVHHAGPLALFEACVQKGVRRVVQISAYGVEGASATLPYQTSKAAVDRALLRLSDDHAFDAVILRPSLIIGEHGQSARLFRALASLPIVPIVGDGSYRFTPLHVDDLARAVLSALNMEPAVSSPRSIIASGVYEVGGAETLTLKQMLLAIRAWLGEDARGPALHLPLTLMKLPALFGDLMNRGPLNSAELSMLKAGAEADVTTFEASFHFIPRGLSELLTIPADEATRWHAKLDQLRLPIRWLTASIWLITPTVSLAQWDLGLDLLYRSGVGESLAPLLLLGSCVMEYLLGTLLMAGKYVRTLGWASIGLMLFFTAFLSVTQSHLWLDPFGSLSKNLPLIAATLAMIALVDPQKKKGR